MDGLTSDLIKPFFIGDSAFTSLNEFKKLLKNIPKDDPKKLKKVLCKLLSFIKVDNFLPIHLDSETEITIDVFNTILNLRGLINKSNVNNKEAIIFLNSENKNIADHTFDVDPCKLLIEHKKLNEIQYSQYLQKDAHSNFLTTADVKNQYPLPIFISDRFLNDPNFTFSSYSENESKISFYHLLFWLIRLFLFGSVNECKIEWKNGHYIDDIIHFIDEGLKTGDSYFEVVLRGSKEFSHFLYDYLFTNLCRSKIEKDFIVKFQFVDFLERDPHFKNIITKYPSICEGLRISNPYPFDLNVFRLNDYEIDPHNIERLLSYGEHFQEIPEIEKEIEIYDEWKKENIELLAFENIFELVRSKLFHQNKDVKNFDDKFGRWFLNSNVSLINREVYSTFKAIHNGDQKEIENQILILKKILNPWSGDDRFFLYFVFHLIESRPNFSSLVSFNEKVYDGFSLLINMVKNCKPFYITKKKDEENHYIFFEKFELKTLNVERLLYCISMFPQKSGSLLRPIYAKLYDFFTFLPFANKTFDLPYLAAFSNEIVNLFRDQLNLSFIFLTTTENCIDLLDSQRFPLICKVVNQFVEWNCLDELKEALKSADLYNKGQNASEKLTSYINKLIEINNKTILYRKYQPEKMHFRLISKENIHSNISLMNTFIPALSHIDFLSNDRQKLVTAYYLLTKSNDNNDKKSRKIPIDKETTLNSALPAVFNFNPDFSKSFARICMVLINQIPENQDFLGFDKNKVVLSLCNELHDHISKNPDSYRTFIWNKIKNSHHSSPQDGLNTLLALFEVYNEEDKEKHLFFNTDDWNDKLSPPEDIKGAESAFNFLQNYIVI